MILFTLQPIYARPFVTRHLNEFSKQPSVIWPVLCPFYRWDKPRPRVSGMTPIFFFKLTSSVHLHTPIHIYTLGYICVYMYVDLFIHISVTTICNLVGQILCKKLYYFSVLPPPHKGNRRFLWPKYLNKESDKMKNSEKRERSSSTRSGMTQSSGLEVHGLNMGS